MKNKITKIILSTLAGVLVLVPFQADAQLGLVQSVPVRSPGEVSAGILDLVGGGASTGNIVGSGTCALSETVSNQVASIISRGLTLLGDNTALIVDLQSQLAIVDGAIVCWTGVLTSASVNSAFASGTIFGFTKANATRDQALAQIAALKNIKKQLEARIQVASQSFWKAVLVGLLLRQTDKLSEKMVSELTEKFKINDYSRYVGAVTDTVYINSMILRYVDNDKDRAIVRSMVQNPFLRDRIHPTIQATADAYVGFDVKNINYGDPNFLKGVGRVANGEELKMVYQSAMIAKTDEVIAKARQAALSEVSQSGGYKATLNNCGPSISQQQQKDIQYKQILDEIKDRELLHESIHASAGASETEKAQIKKEVKDARTKLEKFTDVFGAAAIQICEGTNTPAVKFKDTIQGLIGSQIDKFRDYNDNNLPLVQKLVIEIADNLIGKFVFGDNKKSTGDLVNESVSTLTAGVAGSLSKPSTGVNTTLPTFGQDAPSGPPGNVAGEATTSPSIIIMPRGPTASLR